MTLAERPYIIATRLALTGTQIATYHGEHKSLLVSFFIIFAERHVYNSLEA